MSKPICVIKVDMQASFAGKEQFNIADLMKIFQDKMPDYYVFVIPLNHYSEERELFKFEVFYDKDFNDINYASLKILIQDSLN